jgi:predicted aspartyl protease
MGMVYTEITLKNIADVFRAEDGHLKKEDIRQAKVAAEVDTEILPLIITEELREKLGLAVKGEESTVTAGGREIICHKTEAVEIHWKNRSIVLNVLAAPGLEKVLLGSFPLQCMRLTVDSGTGQVTGINGDEDDLLVL